MICLLLLVTSLSVASERVQSPEALLAALEPAGRDELQSMVEWLRKGGKVGDRWIDLMSGL